MYHDMAPNRKEQQPADRPVPGQAKACDMCARARCLQTSAEMLGLPQTRRRQVKCASEPPTRTSILGWAIRVGLRGWAIRGCPRRGMTQATLALYAAAADRVSDALDLGNVQVHLRVAVRKLSRLRAEAWNGCSPGWDLSCVPRVELSVCCC
ncbi:hypothetical protein K402DRAFT_188692 [Aulographum hederae CBS 113979]|uniref:Uncharacterized protein n=1 Tax=Aulographum hederae CBS 113979 TaxID=1176131 RepID=A0A6G1GP20_9PEZI|nr:hypothetical protein K402DRAFT_188692 [Aulographum hederae CBS 113979]